jgi:hypothetical protein
MRRSVLIFIVYFGKWPPWIDFFLESCRANPTIDWLIIGDSPPPESRPANVRHLVIGFEDYQALVSSKLDIRFRPAHAHKLCDVRPALAYIHRELAEGYDFVGFGDVDLVYGDIRRFYDEQILESYDALSTHPERVSGHFFLMRNTDELASAFMRSPRWRRKLEEPANAWFDENDFAAALRRRGAGMVLRGRRSQLRFFFREAYTTPAATDRMRWYWRDGQLTNEFYPHRGFLYLHFMNWHNSRYYGGRPYIVPGTPAPWERLERIVQMDWRDAARDGFMISPAGIQPIEPLTYGTGR